MTTDYLNLSPEELDSQEASDNRPSWMHTAKKVKGTWDGTLGEGSEMGSDGREFPRLTMTIKNAKFLELDPRDAGRYTDGQDYVVMIPPPLNDGKDYRRPLGMMIKAAGKPLATFKGEVLLTEMAKKPWPTADRATYFYKVEHAGSKGATAPAEIPPELVNAALQVIGGGEYTESNVGLALMKSPICNTSAQLNGKFADGSFIKDMLNAGRLAKGTGDVLVVAGN